MSLTMPTSRYRYGEQSVPRALACLEATVSRIATQNASASQLDQTVPATAMTVSAGSFSMTRDLAGMDTVDQSIQFLPAPIDTSISSSPIVATPAYYLICWQKSGTSIWSAAIRVEDPGDGSQIVLNIPGLATNTTYIASIVTVTTAGVMSPAVFVTFTTPGDTVPPVAPSTPTVTAVIANLKCVWNGKDNAGAAMASDTAFVEVHASAAGGFTPDTSTLVGSLFAESSGVIAGGTKLIPDPTYAALYVKLVAVDFSGNRSTPSAQVGPVTAVKVDGTNDIVANTISAANLVAGSITGDKIAANTVTADKLASGTLDVNQTITVGQLGGTRLEIGKDPLGISNVGLRLYRDQTTAPAVNLDAVTGSAAMIGALSTGLDGEPITVVTPAYFGNMLANAGFESDLSGWVEHDTNATLTPTRDTGVKQVGVASMRLIGIAGLSGIDNYMVASVTPIQVNTMYTISVMVDCTVRTAGALGNRCLSVQGDVSAAGGFKTTTITATTGWKQHKLNWTSGPSDTVMEVRLYGVVGTIYYDNVFVGPADAYFSTMPVSPMIEFVPATPDEVPGGMYTGEVYNGDTDAANDQTSILLRSPGWTADTDSQSSIFLTSDTRTTAYHAAKVEAYPMLSVLNNNALADRIDLWSSGYEAYGFGIRSGRLVAYTGIGGGLAVCNSPNTSAGSSSGTQNITLMGSGDATVKRIKIGGANMRGSNYASCDRTSTAAVASNNPVEGADVGMTLVQSDADNGTIYSSPNFVSQCAGYYAWSFLATIPPNINSAQVWRINWRTSGGSVCGMAMAIINWGFYGTANTLTASSAGYLGGAGYSIRPQIYQNSGGPVTFAANAPATPFHAAMAQVN